MATMKSILNRYKRLEYDNSHNECAILVTKHFGTKDELETLIDIKANRLKRGYILQEEIDVRRNISQKYYRLLCEAVNKEELNNYLNNKL